jgi:hypothetical protein
MNFLSPLPGLGFLLDIFPQLSLWATIVRHSVAENGNAICGWSSSSAISKLLRVFAPLHEN